ncbi:MAG TPA: chemotaxis protein CheW [Candidatus Angelobacter sp.]|nr:chemotaxis protein CheW [Candidatus Angelobacter sp.]
MDTKNTRLRTPEEQMQLDEQMQEEQQQLLPLAEPEQLELLPKAQSERQYCIFRAGRERFCLSVLDVEEVVEWPALTKLPLAPAFLMGIFNLRGSIVPVVDIAFSEGRRPDLPPRHVVVAALKGEEDRDEVRLGIAADEVIGTHATSEPLLTEEAPRDVPQCVGMLRQADRLALALDLKKLTQVFPVPVI